jgi:hypothetical protein
MEVRGSDEPFFYPLENTSTHSNWILLSSRDAIHRSQDRPGEHVVIEAAPAAKGDNVNNLWTTPGAFLLPPLARIS